MKTRHYNTTAMLFGLCYVMFHRWVIILLHQCLIKNTNSLFTCCLLFFTFIVRYDNITPKKSTNQLSWSEQWSTFASLVDSGFEDSTIWIKDNGEDNIDHHNIMAGWCLLLSQRFLIMFANVCDLLSTKLPVKFFGKLLATIGLDESIECFFLCF